VWWMKYPSHPLSNMAIEKWVVGRWIAFTCGDFRIARLAYSKL
jgi:hypothetical protein